MEFKHSEKMRTVIKIILVQIHAYLYLHNNTDLRCTWYYYCHIILSLNILLMYKMLSERIFDVKTLNILRQHQNNIVYEFRKDFKKYVIKIHLHTYV